MLDKVIKNRSVHPTVSPQDAKWGLWVNRVGCGGRGAGECYGMGEEGRVLNEFAMVYITRGRGMFYARPGQGREILAGDMMLLFPGVWHSYGADIETGWNEYWALFGGFWPESILEHDMISVSRPVLRVGLDSTLHRFFVRMIDMAAAEPAGCQTEISALVMQALARALVLSRSHGKKRHKYCSVMEGAVQYLRENVGRAVDLEALAGSLHFSYPHFRRLFRELTGVSPYRYHLQLRIMRAKELLEEGSLPVKEVAAALGFDDPYYFARIFKEKTGVPPSKWRGM